MFQNPHQTHSAARPAWQVGGSSVETVASVSVNVLTHFPLSGEVRPLSNDNTFGSSPRISRFSLFGLGVKQHEALNPRSTLFA